MVRLTKKSKAVQLGETVFRSKLFNAANYSQAILKPAKQNTKLGNGRSKIRIGKWKKFPMFYLTLEERKTCPTTCFHWVDCYGNDMNLGHRIIADDDLIPRLEKEVEQLSKRYPKGFVIRLHVLGDFYSVDYVIAWRRFLKKHSNLFVFGYTANTSGPIRSAISAIRRKYPKRWWMRFSQNASHSNKAPNVIYACHESYEGKHFGCPEQTGKLDSCIECGLCWQTKKSVKFYTHRKETNH